MSLSRSLDIRCSLYVAILKMSQSMCRLSGFLSRRSRHRERLSASMLSPKYKKNAIFSKTTHFCRAMLCISAAIAVIRCPSVCLSVCPSVRLSRSCIVSKRINVSSNFFHHPVAIRASLVQINTEMAEKYSNQRYVVNWHGRYAVSTRSRFMLTPPAFVAPVRGFPSE